MTTENQKLPTCDLESWLGEETDEWLRGVLLEDGLSPIQQVRIQQVSRAGLWARLMEPSQVRLAKMRELLLKGERDPALERARDWAQSWTQEQTDNVIFEACEEAISLLEDLRRHAQADDEADDWCSIAEQLYIRRDDLESVSLLLAYRLQADERLNDTLKRVDAQLMSTLIIGAPFDEYDDNERLYRVWVSDPDAYWAAAQDPDYR